MGIDAFNEGTEITVGNRNFKTNGVAKMNDGTEYSQHFREKYIQDHKDENLVEKHWEKYVQRKKMN